MERSGWARSIGHPFWTAVALAEIAELQAKHGQRAPAVAQLAQLRDSAPSNAISHVAIAQARVGEVEAARKTLERVTEEYGRANVIIAIAQAEVERGRRDEAAALFAQALEGARLLDRPSWRSWRYSAVATAQAKWKFFDDAYKTATLIEGEDSRSYALQVIAAEHARSGSTAEAIMLARGQASHMGRAFALVGAAGGIISSMRPSSD